MPLNKPEKAVVDRCFSQHAGAGLFALSFDIDEISILLSLSGKKPEDLLKQLF